MMNTTSSSDKDKLSNFDEWVNSILRQFGKTPDALELIEEKGKELGIDVVRVDNDEQVSVSSMFLAEEKG